MIPQKKTTPIPPTPAPRKRKQGQSLIEYALILGSLSLAVWGVLLILGDSVSNRFTETSTELTDASPGYLAPINAGVDSATSKLSGLSGTKTAVRPSFTADSALSLQNVNGGEMNVSSAEGKTMRTVRSETLSKTTDVSQNLIQLANLTNNYTLQEIARKALLSASIQAAYQIKFDPFNPTNTAIRDLAKASMEKYSNSDSYSGDKLLGSIENWNLEMIEEQNNIKKDQDLNQDQKTQAIRLIDEVVQATRKTYNVSYVSNLIKSKQITPLLDRDDPRINNPGTVNLLSSEAKKVLESNLANAALKTTLVNGVALQSSPYIYTKAQVNRRKKKISSPKR